MRWIFGVVGLVIGSAMAPLLGASDVSGAIVGALVGFAFGVWLGQKSSAQRPANAGAENDADGSPTLATRVERLERQVSALTQELAQLRAPGAKRTNGSDIVQPVPASPVQSPAAAAQIAPAGSPKFRTDSQTIPAPSGDHPSETQSGTSVPPRAYTRREHCADRSTAAAYTECVRRCVVRGARLACRRQHGSARRHHRALFRRGLSTQIRGR